MMMFWQLFKDVLRSDSVMMDDDFVAMGGNSLSAMKLQIVLNEKLGVNLYSNEIIELKTPLAIANHIKSDSGIYSPVFQITVLMISVLCLKPN